MCGSWFHISAPFFIKIPYPTFFLYCYSVHVSHTQFWQILLPRSIQISTPAPFFSEIPDPKTTLPDPLILYKYKWRQFASIKINCKVHHLVKCHTVHCRTPKVTAPWLLVFNGVLTSIETASCSLKYRKVWDRGRTLKHSQYRWTFLAPPGPTCNLLDVLMRVALWVVNTINKITTRKLNIHKMVGLKTQTLHTIEFEAIENLTLALCKCQK